MKKEKKLKRSNYLQGAFIATFGIVLSKILGIIYVIPFYAIIGEAGGALYGYAYNIYSIFLGISSAGIPLAISKLISEYDTLGYHHAKEKTFKVAKRILMVMGILSFAILVLFTEPIAYLIIGNIKGGNSISDIVYVIRVISLSILVVPLLSVYRGYLQGHRYMEPSSVSQVLEQLIRVIIIIVGSYLAKYIFDLSLKETVAIALFGATIGAFISWLYLVRKVHIHKKEFAKSEIKEEEKGITSKHIAYQILLYSFPFIFGNVCKSLYNSVDTFFVVKTLVNHLGYTVTSAEAIMSVISTWGNKLNMIVIAIGTGFMSSLTPNLTRSLVKGDKRDVHDIINKTIQILVFIALPMTVGLSFLAKPVWMIFYGESLYGPSVFSFSIFTAFITILLTTCTTVLLNLKEYKMLFLNLTVGLVVNAIFDVPSMILFGHIGIPAYYGATFSTILGNVISILIVYIFLHKKYEVNFIDTIKRVFKIIVSVIVMVLVLCLVKFVVPFTALTRISSIFIVILYAMIGAVVYYLMVKYFRLIDDIFGNNIIKRLLKRS